VSVRHTDRHDALSQADTEASYNFTPSTAASAAAANYIPDNSDRCHHHEQYMQHQCAVSEQDQKPMYPQHLLRRRTETFGCHVLHVWQGLAHPLTLHCVWTDTKCADLSWSEIGDHIREDHNDHRSSARVWGLSFLFRVESSGVLAF